MEALLADMTSRRGWMITHVAIPSFLGSVGALVVGLLLNVGLIGLFSAILVWAPHHTALCNSTNNQKHSNN